MSLPHPQHTSKPGRPPRDPPPALFLHPLPSPAASHVSLPSPSSPTAATAAGVGPGTSRLPASTQPKAPATSVTADPQTHSHARNPSLQPTPSNDPLTAALSSLSKPAATAAPSSANTMASRRGGPGAALTPLQTTTATTARRESTRATDRTDALWSEMQATLEEVELSASGGTRVFGPDHDRKLAELRAAQIALAQAWARSEADEVIETTAGAAAAGVGSVSMERAAGGGGGGGGELKTDGTGGTAEGGAARSVGTGTGSIRPGSAGGAVAADRLGQKLEQETESDIAFAKKRREANDRYFQKVNQGVLNVVAKLEDVATAMRAVEQESKDVWGDESVPSSARP